MHRAIAARRRALPRVSFAACVAALALLGCGTAKGIGDPCTAADQCPGTQTYRGDCANNLPNGYCTRQCDLDVDCGTGAFCVTTVGGPVCVKQCTAAKDCRVSEGYSCTGRGASDRLYCASPGS